MVPVEVAVELSVVVPVNVWVVVAVEDPVVVSEVVGVVKSHSANDPSANDARASFSSVTTMAQFAPTLTRSPAVHVIFGCTWPQQECRCKYECTRVGIVHCFWQAMPLTSTSSTAKGHAHSIVGLPCPS